MSVKGENELFFFFLTYGLLVKDKGLVQLDCSFAKQYYDWERWQTKVEQEKPQRHSSFVATKFPLWIMNPYFLW